MQRIDNIEEFIREIDKNIDIYILGAGKDGEECCRTLQISGYNVKGFIDEKRKKRGRVIEGVSVAVPEDFIDFQIDKIIYFLCIGEISFYSNEDISSMGICSWIKDKNKIVIVDKSEAIYRRFQWNCKQRNINLSKEIIDLNTMVIPNFLKISETVRKVFLSECHDLIFPAIFNDYSMIDEGPYEINEVRLEQGDIVIDAGANLGIFSAYAANISDKIYAFEPVPKTLELLRMTQNLYQNKIKVIDKALSDRTEIENMTNLEYLGQNRICRYDFDKGNTIIVNTITLDNFIEQFSIPKVDFIKVDIEGEERNMLIGAKETLKKFAPKLAICTYHMKDDPDILEDIVLKANSKYKIIHKYKKMFAYV